MPPPQDPYSKLMFGEREKRIKKDIRLGIDEAARKFQTAHSHWTISIYKNVQAPKFTLRKVWKQLIK